MNKEQEVLKFLFESSKKDSNQFYDIKPVAGNDALMIAKKLLKSGHVKDDIQNDLTSVRCAISVEGIRAIDPPYIDRKITELLEHTGEAGSIWNVVDLLKEKPEGFQFCFDLANDMQNRDLVKLLYAFYPSKVMVEMTLEGVRAAR
ncbi:MAG TPA: hypothetical protein VK508_02455 [Cyclobacteriaceae bacterium]|nr:hypothetical protein [Cyclobacteriaceae bacterium]